MTGCSESERGGASASALCVLEWNAAGHHPTYLRLYTRALLRLGHRVAALAPDAAALRAWWDSAEAGLSAEERGRAAAADMPRADFSLRRTRPTQAWRRWRLGWRTRRALAGLERELGTRAGQVFFSCIYEHEAALVGLLARGLGRPWSGLYMQAAAYRQPGVPVLGANRDYPIRRLWREPGLAGLLTLDEGMAERIAADCGRPVLAAPDPTDATLGPEDETSRRVAEFKGDRPLVAVCGHLLPSKGVATLARAALAAEEEEGGAERFLFAGEVAWKLFAPEEAEVLRRAFALPGRVLALDRRIPTEGGYNRIVAGCDVLCAAYRDFPHSSNTLAKAAAFEKPLVVSDGHLMAERVRAYRLGEVVARDDPTALLAAIRRVTAAAWRAGNAPRWRDYREAHSEARLEAVLAGLFSSR